MGLAELQAKQEKLVKATAALANLADDPKALLERSAEIAEMAKEFQKAALRLSEELDPKGSGGREEVVVLTPDQRERVAQSTGVAMETLVVRDADGSFARAMPSQQKMVIERMAYRQATQLAAKKAKREAVEKLVKQLKKLDDPGLEDLIRSIEDDPSLETMARQQEDAGKRALEKLDGQG